MIDNSPAKAPWVVFITVAVEDRTKTIEQGAYASKDVDYAHITPPGSKDCVEKPVQDWFDALRQQVKDGRFPSDWLTHYERQYDAWKQGAELPEDGFPVRNWAAASPAQLDTLRKMNVRTVEQVAAANEDVIRGLGMGGRGLVELAKTFLAQKKDNHLAMENQAMSMKLATAEETAAAQAETIKTMQAQINMLMGNRQEAGPGNSPQPPTDASKIGLDDLLSNDVSGNKSAPVKL